MISISTPTFDFDGSRVFREVAPVQVSDKTRRVSRTATLDGGVSVYDGGYADGDRDIEIIVYDPSAEDKAFCDYIIENYSEVIVSTSEGAFLACPRSCGIDSKGDLNFKFYVKEKIS